MSPEVREREGRKEEGMKGGGGEKKGRKGIIEFNFTAKDRIWITYKANGLFIVSYLPLILKTMLKTRIPQNA